MHFRGPLNLHNVAVYNLGSETSKRDLKPSIHERRHGHSHQRFHEKRAVGDKVVATINGQVVSWTNEYGGGAPAAPTPAPGSNDPHVKSTGGDSYDKPKSPSKGSSKAPTIPAGKWGRVAYYSSESGESNGLTFLNNEGAWAKGVTQAFGCALSLAADNLFGIASTPSTPKESSVPDGKEIIIMTDKQCDGDSCGFTRPGATAYRMFPQTT